MTRPASTVFTAEEVATHCSVHDAWVIVGKRVYRLPSDFSESHTGGDVVFSVYGGDATELFAVHDHSDLAKMHLERYWIGMLAEKKVTPQSASLADEQRQQKPASSDSPCPISSVCTTTPAEKNPAKGSSGRLAKQEDGDCSCLIQ